MAFTGSNWGRRVLLTGLSPSATLSGFVALVSLDNVPVEAVDAGSNSALNGGGDLRFSTDDAGVNQLPLEVVSYVTDATEGNRSCQLWIRFPTYASGTREVYMFYKKLGETQPAVTASFGRNEVWQDRFLITHLESTSAIDSSGNNILTAGSGVSLVTDGAALGNGNAFDGTINGQYSAPDSNVFDAVNISISVWIETTASTPVNARIFGKQNNYNFIVRTNALYCELWTDGGVKTFLLSGNNLTVGTRYLAALDYDGTDIKYYINGSEVGSSTVSGGNLNFGGDSAHIANRGGSSESLPAELFLLDGCAESKSAAMYSSEYDNQSDPVTFWTTGTPETPSGGSVSITAESGSYSVSGTDVSLLVTSIMQASSGFYSISGTNVELLKGSVVDLASGSYSLTGTDATLTFTPLGSFTLIADTGTYNHTGADINFNRNRVMIASSGIYTLSGTDVQIILPGQIWTEKTSVSTSWGDQVNVVTNWNNQTNVTTIWTDK